MEKEKEGRKNKEKGKCTELRFVEKLLLSIDQRDSLKREREREREDG
jgi:hypothetical protein